MALEICLMREASPAAPGIPGEACPETLVPVWNPASSTSKARGTKGSTNELVA